MSRKWSPMSPRPRHQCADKGPASRSVTRHCGSKTISLHYSFLVVSRRDRCSGSCDGNPLPNLPNATAHAGSATIRETCANTSSRARSPKTIPSSSRGLGTRAVRASYPVSLTHVETILGTELSGKRLEILKAIVPNTAPVAVLWNDTNPGMAIRAREAQSSSDKLGLNLESIGVHDLISFDAAFAKINSSQFNALLTLVDPFTHEHRQRIIDFAAKRLL